MKRREFVACGLVSSLAARAWTSGHKEEQSQTSGELRSQFPRALQETYLNAAGLMPLGAFTRVGLEKYMAYQTLGPHSGELDYVKQMLAETPQLFADLMGVQKGEVGLVHCTKAGEQIALDALDAIKPKGGVVTNDLHFSGSLHNLLGMQKAGRSLKILKSEDWQVRPEAWIEAIDESTALVALSLVSNINGHLEAIKAITSHAHRHGALVYADVIQAAGIVPLNLPELGVDVAACSSYKWLYGVFGAGFVYVKQALQGKVLKDRLFPGRVAYNAKPWMNEPDPNQDMWDYKAPRDATRYQPGHVSYMGYCAAYEGLKFIHNFGVENALAHSVKLNQQLKAHLNPQKFQCISPHSEQTPIITFECRDPEVVEKKLEQAQIVCRMMGHRLRISPALYNNEADIERLVNVLNT